MIPSSRTATLTGATREQIRDEYVTGDETLSEVGKRHGVPIKTMERWSSRGLNEGRSWGELRAAFRSDVSDRAMDAKAKTLAQTMAKVNERAANVADAALARLEEIIGSGVPMENKDLIAAAKLATAIKVMVSGDPSGAGPVDVKLKLDELDLESLRKLADLG